MIEFLLGNRSQNEVKYIVEITKSLAARFSEEKWVYNVYSNSFELMNFIDSRNLVNIACLDVTMENGVAIAESARSNNEKSFIVIVADNTIPPMHYIKPSIKAGSLIIRPFTLKTLEQVLEESVKSYMADFENADSSNGFVIETKEGKQVITYNQINFFEARDKKIVLNAGNRELTFYDTIENLEQQLPDIFVRCHRSFIVSKHKISKILFSQNVIELREGYNIPLSRTYKKLLKEWK